MRATRAPGLAGAALLLLISCGGKPVVPHSGVPALTAEVITAQPSAPEDPAEGECWDTDVIPAIFETTTEQTLVSPEVRDDQGNLVSAATYRTVQKLRIVQERSEAWFRVPCPETEDAAFWATVQRALKARGYYTDVVTGENDPATAEAVRRFQSERGLDSPVLSRAAAQDLGVVAVPLEELR